jgi:hypothetical protein
MSRYSEEMRSFYRSNPKMMLMVSLRAKVAREGKSVEEAGPVHDCILKRSNPLQSRFSRRCRDQFDESELPSTTTSFRQQRQQQPQNS